MAKGDAQRTQNYADDYNKAVLDDMVSPQRHRLWENYYQQVLPGAQRDYGNIMGRYQNFADTGGYSDAELGNIRSRAISPIRSVYSRSLSELDRHKALQGGYMPNYAAARSRFAREQSQATSDASTNAEAAIAQMRNQGRLAGLAGMSGMYSATPGMANMLGNQVITSTGQAIDLGRLNLMVAELAKGGKIDWGKWAQIAGSIGLGVAALSDRDAKEDIKLVTRKSIIEKFKKIPIYDWKYKGDSAKHTGPMAQDYKKIFGGHGEGKRIHLADVIGDIVQLGKAVASEV